MSDQPRIPVTFEFRREDGEVMTLDTHLAALPQPGHLVAWDEGHAALPVLQVIVVPDRAIVRIRGLMRLGSVPIYLAGGWR